MLMLCPQVTSLEFDWWKTPKDVANVNAIAPGNIPKNIFEGTPAHVTDVVINNTDNLEQEENPNLQQQLKQFYQLHLEKAKTNIPIRRWMLWKT